MKTWILRLVRQDARDWWYHAQLRQQGRIEDACRLERQAIRNTVAPIRQAITYGVECVYVTPDYGVTCVLFSDPPREQRGHGSQHTAAISGPHPGDARVWLLLASLHGWEKRRHAA